MGRDEDLWCHNCDVEKIDCECPEPFDEAALKKTGWQPIETAPRDGTIVLACGEYDPKHKYGLQSHPMSVRWEIFHPNAPGKGLWRDKNGHKMMHLTHWMALPDPPNNGG